MKAYSRREFVGLAAAGAGAFVVGCSLDTAARQVLTRENALIKARPGTPTQTPTVGYSALGITSARDGFLYVPTTYQASTPAPLVVLLHAGGSSAKYWQDGGIGSLVDDLGIVVLAPDSRHLSWDLLTPNVQGFGPDAAFINTALAYTFQRCNINPARIALGGFSDGATESFGLGFINGDFFTHVIAYSPGLLFAPWVQGKPKVFVSHGMLDTVFSFDNTRTQIVPNLIAAGYATTFVEFTGGHEVPGTIARQSFEWFLA